jgi:hypothetical protein
MLIRLFSIVHHPAVHALLRILISNKLFCKLSILSFSLLYINLFWGCWFYIEVNYTSSLSRRDFSYTYIISSGVDIAPLISEF